MQLPTPDTTQAGLDGRKAEINTNTYQYLHYFAAGIIVPHQFLMPLVSEDTGAPDCCKLKFCPIMALAGQ